MSELVRVIRRLRVWPSSRVGKCMCCLRWKFFKNARKFVRCCQVRVSMNVEVARDDKFRR